MVVINVDAHIATRVITDRRHHHHHHHHHHGQRHNRCGIEHLFIFYEQLAHQFCSHVEKAVDSPSIHQSLSKHS